MITVKAEKLKMTQIFKEDKVIPITLVRTEKTDELKEGEFITVSGVSRGKGFQGVVKRYSFRGGPKTHGQKNRHRAPGSIGNTSPQRVMKGRKMAGHMGNVTVTIKNLKIEGVDKEKGIVMLKGAVPGSAGSKLKLKVL